MYRSTHFCPRHETKLGDQLHALAALSLGKEPRYSLDRRLGDSQNRSWRESGKIAATTTTKCRTTRSKASMIFDCSNTGTADRNLAGGDVRAFLRSVALNLQVFGKGRFFVQRAYQTFERIQCFRINSVWDRSIGLIREQWIMTTTITGNRAIVQLNRNSQSLSRSPKVHYRDHNSQPMGTHGSISHHYTLFVYNPL
jgi:hypothetical protein